LNGHTPAQVAGLNLSKNQKRKSLLVAWRFFTISVAILSCYFTEPCPLSERVKFGNRFFANFKLELWSDLMKKWSNGYYHPQKSA
jgi:hypothetical protein